MKKIYLFFLFTSVNLCLGQFQEKENNNDTTHTAYLDELVISANKSPELRRFVAQQIKIITPSTIMNFNAQNTADILSNTGVVAMQKSQQGGGSPILRGFEASRVLLIVDGVRMNNLIYRAGHLQNAITVDNNMLDRVEILFGPSSTVYGSDALGGAIHFFTKEPKLKADTNAVSGNSFLRMGTVNEEKTFHTDVNLGGKKIAALTSITYSTFEDLKMGKRTNPSFGEQFGLRNNFVERSTDNQSDELKVNNNPVIQKFSGYKQFDFLEKIQFKTSERIDHLFNFQYSKSTDIPRYDRLTDPGTGNTGLKFAQWYYGPQQRALGYYRLKINQTGKLADRITATLSYQAIDESRHQRRFLNNELQHRNESVDVIGLTVDAQKEVDKSEFRWGIDGQLNRLKSKAHAQNVITGQLTPLDTRYPNGTNTMGFMATYFTHTLKVSSKITLNDGIRIGSSWLTAAFRDKTFFPFPFDEVKQHRLTGSTNAGLILTPGNWKISMMVNTGFRIPNIDDLAKVFESVAGNSTTTGTIIVPNPNLKPEKTINGDIGITKFLGSLARLEGVFFVTNFYDAIVTQPFLFGGQSVITYNGFQANVYANQNKNRAIIYGTAVQFRVDANELWNFSATYNYTKGKVKNDSGPDSPLDHIAPAFGRSAIQYTGRKVRGEIFFNFSSWKRLADYSSSGEDNLQYATPDGMPSWFTFNFRLAINVSKQLAVQSGIDNIFDLQYRTFASGINAPGRNFFLTLRINF